MKKIGIDIGHNLAKDVGAVGTRNEDELNLLVGGLLISKLKMEGFNVVNCTPSNAATLSESLEKRCLTANLENVDFFLSIHHNKCIGGYGTEVLVYKEGTGAEIGRHILKETELIGFKNRGIKIRKDLYVLKNTVMPALLVECAFIDSEEDMRIYNIKKMSEALFNGICNYYNSNKKIYYTIEKGDTLYKIANKFKVTINSIVKLNAIENPNMIKAGDRIRVL